jgi:hypothetical protein
MHELLGFLQTGSSELPTMLRLSSARSCFTLRDTGLAHYRTLQALPLVLGSDRQDDADYLDTCRSKRNTAEYDSAGRISPEEAKELISFARALRARVVVWLLEHNPTLAPREE